MSGTGEERWRNSRGQQSAPPPNAPPQNQNQNQNRHGNQQPRQNSSREGGGPQSKQNTGGQGSIIVTGNAWANSDRGNRDWAAHGLPLEQHVPVRGFNALEVRDTLKNAYNSVTSENGKPLKYKAAATQPKNAKSGGPWASRPNMMGNGKDFFLELRKQVSALQQSGERAGG